MKQLDIERRVAISLAVGRYLRSAERFNEASREFTEACKSLRQQLGTEQRFVVQSDFKHYLVTSDRQGNFDVEQIQTL
jgi:predicted class III extradiol MEMO1 family dioxygenase